MIASRPAAAAGGSAQVLLLALQKQVLAVLAAGGASATARLAAAISNTGPAHRVAVEVVGGKPALVIPAPLLLLPGSGVARYRRMAAALGELLGGASGWELTACSGTGKLVLVPGSVVSRVQALVALSSAMSG